MCAFELGVGSIVVAFDSRLFESSIHSLDLAVGPRVVWLGQSVLDAVCVTQHVEHMSAPSRCRPETVLRQVRELDSIVGEHGVDFVRNGFEKGFEEGCGRLSRSSLMQFGIGKLRRSVDRYEQIEFAFLGAHFGNVEMEIADRIGLELLSCRFVAFGFWQTTDPVPLKAPMQG